MLGRIRFDDGNRVETVGVVEVTGRFLAEEGNTVRVKIHPPYQGRDEITVPERRVAWVGHPDTVTEE